MLAPLAHRALAVCGDARAGFFLPDYRHALTSNRYRLAHAAAARDALEAEGHRVVLIKGGSFLVRFGGSDVGIRPMSDLDLLVDPHAFAAAGQVLTRLGFAPASGRFRFSRRAAPSRPFVQRFGAAQVELDLHRAVAQWPLAGTLRRELFAGAARVGGWLVPTPSAAFCLAALHRARHGYVWSCLDLLELRRIADTLDADGWDALVDTARICRLTGAAYAAFRQALWWFGEDEAGRARLARLAVGVGGTRRRLLERMAPVDGPLAPSPAWNRPLVRNLVVMPCATETPVQALTALGVFLPLRLAEEWLHTRQADGGTAARLGRVVRHAVWGAERAVRPDAAAPEGREAPE